MVRVTVPGTNPSGVERAEETSLLAAELFRAIAKGLELGDGGESGKQADEPEHSFRVHPLRRRPP